MKRISNSCAPERLADVEPVVIRHIVAELNRRGVNSSAVFKGLGFDAESLKDTEFYVSYAQTSQVIRRTLRLLGDCHLGLYLGATVNLVSWGTCLIGLMACASTRDMLQFAADFLPSTGRLLKLRFEDSPKGPRIVARARFEEPAVEAFLVEKTFAALVRACKNIAGPAYGPSRVEFVMPSPERKVDHLRVMECQVAFGRSRNCMHFPQKPVVIATADAVIAEKARRQLAPQCSTRSPAHELESIIVQAFQGRLDAPPLLADIARTINMSERTLRRRLADAGRNYIGLLDRERREQALALIHGQHAFRQVAAETGFVDVRSLRRAVKRWTGRTPTSVLEGD